MNIRYCVLIITISLFGCIGFAQNNQLIKINNELELIKLSENAFIHTSYINNPTWGRIGANGFIFIQNRKAFLFDTPMSDSITNILVSWLEDSLKVSFVGFVPNHWHIDCMGGLGYLKNKGIESWANQLTIDKAITENLPVPEAGFKDSLNLLLEGQGIKCYYFGAAHSLDNIVVYIPSEKILFAGCMVKDFNTKTLGNTVDGDLIEYPKTISKVIEHFQDAQIVIPGHGNYGGKELLYYTLDLSKKQK